MGPTIPASAQMVCAPHPLVTMSVSMRGPCLTGQEQFGCLPIIDRWLTRRSHRCNPPPMAKENMRPGQFIADRLRELGWTQRVLAAASGLSEQVISKVVSGRRAIDAKTALTLADCLGVEAERLMEMQTSYALAMARMDGIPQQGGESAGRVLARFPVSVMIQRGWINADGIRDTERVESEITRFFGAKSLEDLPAMHHAAKRTHALAGPTAEQLAWLYRVRQIASEMLAGRYTDRSVDVALARLQPLRASTEAIRDVPRIMAEAGIRFLVVETIPRALIDGVCFWLKDSAPVVALSLRHDRVDNFWFVLRHELEHVRLAHGKDTQETMLDVDMEGGNGGGASVVEEELAANTAAADFCVPKKSMDAFVARKAPFYKERDLIGFARAMGVHPGLVAGQLQHRTGRYERFRQHQERVRHIICSTAVVDGWGDVYPVGEGP